MKVSAFNHFSDIGSHMPVRQLSPSPVLGFENFANFEQFRPNEVIGGGRSAPLDPKYSSAVRAVLPFPNGVLVLQRSFARRLQSEMGAEYGLGMIIPLSFQAKINGRRFDNSTIIVTRGKTPIDAVEEHPNTYLMLRLNSDMRHMGWADFDTGMRSIATSPEQTARLGFLIQEIFCFAAEANNLDDVRDSMQEALIAALDPLLSSSRGEQTNISLAEKYRKMVNDLDETVRFNDSSLSCEQLACDLQISVRTLYSAVRAVHGMSLQRYLAGKRLWSVRRKLKRGQSAVNVKQIAQSHGFWHMGEFSRAYKMHFAELPSETLSRARRYQQAA